MGLSIDELELQSTDLLPVREVMSGFCCQGGGGSLFLQQGLVNVDLHEVDILADNNALSGLDTNVAGIG